MLKQRLYLSKIAGWSLIEMLAVMALMGSLLATVRPVVNGVLRGIARSASFDQALAMLEQARASAITEGRSAFLVFSDEQFPEGQQHRMAAIFVEDLDPANPPVQVSPWRELPKGVIYRNTPKQTPSLDSSEAVFRFPVKGSTDMGLPFLKFESTGELSYPEGGQNERLYLQFDAREELPPKEGIQIARFSGKPTYFKED